jgi:ribosomal protein L12E/L44/L45/RPP1/RPP2
MKARSRTLPAKSLEEVLANIDSDMAAVVTALAEERRIARAARRRRQAAARREHAHAA